MSIFDKVKQGMLESTKAIREISSEMTEVTRVKMNLAKENAKIEEMYYELGKSMLFSIDICETCTSFPKEISTTLKDMKDTLSKIKEYEAKIESLKGIVKCSCCGFVIENEAKFCSNCGSKVEAMMIEEAAPESTESCCNCEECSCKDIEKPEE